MKTLRENEQFGNLYDSSIYLLKKKKKIKKDYYTVTKQVNIRLSIEYS